MQEEPGSAYINHLMEEAEKGGIKIHISAINVGEIFYRLHKSGKSKVAASFLSDVKRKVFPWQVVPATNARVWEAAKLKGEYKISYADAFAMVLARETGICRWGHESLAKYAGGAGVAGRALVSSRLPAGTALVT